MRKITLLIILLTIWMTVLMAQTISEYIFSTATNGSLEDMSSGTTDLLPTGTYYYGVASDVTDIGFSFNFGAGLYSQFSINSNSQMQLGGTAITGGGVAPTAGTPLLAPLSGWACIRTTGKVHYKVLGTAPNRRLVVEWVDMRVPYASYAESGTYCKLQTWLYETSNVVKFVYGTMYRMGTIAQARGVFISTSNVAGSVGNVKTITTTPTFDTAGTGVLTTPFPSNTMTNLNSSANGSRRVFTFTPPVASTVPNPAVLVGPDNSGWAFTNAILNWDGGGGQPTSYDVYFGTDPNPPLVVNQSYGYYAPDLAPGTTYYWKIVPKNAIGSATGCPIWSFMTPTATQIAESFESTTWPPPGWSNPNSFSRTTTSGFAKDGIASAVKATSTTGVYVLSTPMCQITAGSTLDFYSMASTTTRIMQVVYSTDRTTWTQLGTNVTYAATNTWYRNTINLSSLAGSDYYLGFRTPAQTLSGNVYIDYVFGPEIIPEIPGAVTLTSPINGFGYVVTKPTFTWSTNTTTGGVPTSYTLYCDTNTNPTTLLATTTEPSFTAITSLDELTQYYWKVVANNSAGSSPESAIRNFTTTVNTPVASTNPVPADSATGVANDATLSWDEVTNISYYKVYFGTTLPTTVTNYAFTNSWTPPTMTDGTTYYWQVIPYHQYAGDAVDCPVWSFTTLALPMAATNPMPADMAVNVAVDAILSWNSVADAESYDVYFGTTLPGTPNENVTDTSWAPPVMDNSTNYSWKIVPKNVLGEAIDCPTWSFTTIIALPLAATNPIPTDLATNVAVNDTLFWNSVTDAESYDVYFGTTLPGTPNENVVTTHWVPAIMDYNTTFSWKIVPKNVAGEAIDCPIWSFTTLVIPPIAATNPKPADLATNVAIDDTLFWDSVTDAESYDIYFGTTLPGTPNENVTSTSWIPPVMDNSTTYSWKIVPKNVAGEAIDCPTWSFTTIIALPLAAANPLPTDLAVNVAIDDTLFWDSVTDAESYDVYFGTTLPGTPNENTTGTSWTPPLMDNNTNYSWKIVPKNVAGEAIDCPTWTFTTIAAILPAPTNLSIAVNGANIELNWDAVPGADSYCIYTAPDYRTPFIDWVLIDTVTTTMYTDDNLVAVHKCYKVTAITLP